MEQNKIENEDMIIKLNNKNKIKYDKLMKSNIAEMKNLRNIHAKQIEEQETNFNNKLNKIEELKMEEMEKASNTIARLEGIIKEKNKEKLNNIIKAKTETDEPQLMETEDNSQIINPSTAVYNCKTCGKIFNMKAKLRNHTNRYHNTKTK